VGIEKEIVDRASDIVVMGDIPPGAARGIELRKPPGQESSHIEALGPARRRVRHGILEHEGQEVVDPALLHDEPAIHIGLADSEMRVQRKLSLEPPVGEPGDYWGAFTIAELEGLAVVGDQGEIAALHDSAEQNFERLEHWHASTLGARVRSLP